MFLQGIKNWAFISSEKEKKSTGFFHIFSNLSMNCVPSIVFITTSLIKKAVFGILYFSPHPTLIIPQPAGGWLLFLITPSTQS